MVQFTVFQVVFMHPVIIHGLAGIFTHTKKDQSDVHYIIAEKFSKTQDIKYRGDKY